MNRALATVLRRAIEHIREAATNSDMSEGALQMEAARSAVLDAVWRILVIYLGTPPISFTWQHRDKDENFHRKGTYTPLEFAHEIVPQVFEPWASLGHDPCEEHPVGRTYVQEHTPFMEVALPTGTFRWSSTPARKPLSTPSSPGKRSGSPATSSSSTRVSAFGTLTCTTTGPCTGLTSRCRRPRGCGCVSPVAPTR